jgi:hypothetical protein
MMNAVPDEAGDGEKLWDVNVVGHDVSCMNTSLIVKW